MMSHPEYPTPDELQQRLQQGNDQAAADFESLIGPDLEALAELAHERLKLTIPETVLKERLIRWSGMYLRSVPTEKLPKDRNGLRDVVRVVASMMLRSAQPRDASVRTSTPTDTDVARWQCGSVQLQSRCLRLESAGGDLLLCDEADDDHWFFLADVTGFGQAVQNVKGVLNQLWNAAEFVELRKNSNHSPKTLLTEISIAISQVLNAQWPCVVFVEAVAMRISKRKHDKRKQDRRRGPIVPQQPSKLQDDRRTLEIATAGIARIVKFSRRNRLVRVVPLCGTPWKSVSPNESASKTEPEIAERIQEIGLGDEFLVGTDGLFFQRTSSGKLGESLSNLTIAELQRDGLMQAVWNKLDHTFREHQQKDDIICLSAGRSCKCGRGGEECVSFVKEHLETGSSQAIQQLQSKFESDIRETVERHLRGHNEATWQDAVQETWTKAQAANQKNVKHLKTWLQKPNRGPFCFWLYSVARSAANDQLPKKPNKPTLTWDSKRNCWIGANRGDKGAKHLWYDHDRACWMGYITKWNNSASVLEGQKTPETLASAYERLVRLWKEVRTRRPAPVQTDKEVEEASEEVRRCVARLRPELQEIFRLVYVDNRTPDECVRELGFGSEGTFFNRQRELHDRIRDMYRQLNRGRDIT